LNPTKSSHTFETLQQANLDHPDQDNTNIANEKLNIETKSLAYNMLVKQLLIRVVQYDLHRRDE